jgi:Na+/proline symporter
VILAEIPGGWAHVASVASQADKLRLFDFQFAPTLEFLSKPYTFWAGIAGGCFLTMASHGTDQLMVQRLLSAKTEGQSRLALMTSWLVIFFQFSLFLLIGILLFVYHQDFGLAPPEQTDRIYPQFVWNQLPAGVAGLITAAILAAAMANLSAALNSLASTTVVDFFRLHQRQRAEADSLRLARLATLLWGGVLLGIGIMARKWGSVLEAGLTIASIPFGALLGVFLLGVLTRRPGQAAAVAGVLAGLSVIVCVRFLTPVAWTWYVLIGTLATFGVGSLASFFKIADSGAFYGKDPGL